MSKHYVCNPFPFIQSSPVQSSTTITITTAIFNVQCVVQVTIRWKSVQSAGDLFFVKNLKNRGRAKTVVPKYRSNIYLHRVQSGECQTRPDHTIHHHTTPHQPHSTAGYIRTEQNRIEWASVPAPPPPPPSSSPSPSQPAPHNPYSPPKTALSRANQKNPPACVKALYPHTYTVNPS